MADPATIDFEAEGLLEGLEGEEREARLALLRELAEDGVGLEELREAVAAGRLPLLPVERALVRDGPRYTARRSPSRSGLELKLLQRSTARARVCRCRTRRSAVLTEDDVEAAQAPRRRSATPGSPRRTCSRWRGRSGWRARRIAEANRELIMRHPGPAGGQRA